jgi:hypothetical protein
VNGGLVVIEDALGLGGVEGVLPFGNDDGGDGVADDVNDGAGDVGEALDAEQQDEAGNGDLMHGSERGGEGDEARSGDSCGAGCPISRF